MAVLPTIVGTFLVGERTVGTYTDERWITVVRLDGVALDLAGVIADVTVRHGRAGAADPPQASSATVTLWPVTRELTGSFRVGVSLELRASSPAGEWPLFMGRVSDAEVNGSTLSIVAAGILANASRVELDLTGWALEPWSARAARLFAATPFAGTVQADPTFDPLVEVPVVSSTDRLTFDSYAQSLRDDVGAAIVDQPDGTLLAQALGARATLGAVHALDPAKVLYSPRWVQALEVVNRVGVQYGPDSAPALVVSTDSASIGLYGRRYGDLQTRLHASADATTRATQALSRAAYPRWVMPDALVLEPIPGLAVGDRVVLTDLPPGSPFPSWTPVVEGWTDELAGGPRSWTQALALSDPLLSGLSLAWSQLPASGLPWNAVNPSLQWFEANSLDDFT